MPSLREESTEYGAISKTPTASAPPWTDVPSCSCNNDLADLIDRAPTGLAEFITTHRIEFSR